MRRLAVWARAFRLRFFTASLLPLLLGAVIAREEGAISSWRWLLVFGVVLTAHAASNLLNDLYDDLYGTDRINEHYSPFNGGSRVLQEELISRAVLMRAIRLCYAVGILCLLLLSQAGGGWGVLILGLAGFGCGYFYSAPPFRLAGTSYGELLVGLAFGPLLVLGTTMGLTGVFKPEALLVSLPVGVLITGVILINEFPDYQADRATGKNTLVVRLGKERCFRGLALLLGAAYLLMTVNLLLLGSYRYLLSFVFTLPLAVWVYRFGKRHLEEAKKFVPACAGMMIIHLLNSLLLVLACWRR